MANGFGSLWIGTSGIQSSSNALNTTANNLTNVNTDGYVREQVVFEDRDYKKIGTAAVGTQYAGLGVQVGTIVHARDMFLDKAYRTETGRYSFYQASSDAVQEVQVYLQESEGEAFRLAIADFYEAFAEFAKDPSDTVNQNLVLQKASLFLSRADAVNNGLKDYQTIINSKITENVERINEIGKEIVRLNKRIQAIEANHVEQAMDLRDTRDLLLDELSGLARISYHEDNGGIVHVEIEGVEFVDEVQFNSIGLDRDLRTGFVTPYWVHLSDLTDEDKPIYYPVFSTENVNGIDYLSNVSAAQNSDMGQIKALMMARGDAQANFLTMLGLEKDTYDRTLSSSIMMNTEAELDTLLHQMATTINDLFSRTDKVSTVYESDFKEINGLDGLAYGQDFEFVYQDDDGNDVSMKGDIRVCDVYNADVGSDGELPPRELFVRTGCERYTAVEATLMKKDGSGPVTDADGNAIKKTIYIYNEEDYEDTSKCYTLNSLSVNKELVEQESLLPYMKYMDQTQTDYGLGAKLEAMWTSQDFNLNPSDTTPCSFTEFYTKWIGEVGTTGSVYETTAQSLEGTQEQIEFSRQGQIGVSSDEELTNMIKYQQAYNAASRYINVISEMIEHIITAMAT